MRKRAIAADYDADFAAWAASQAEGLRNGAPIDAPNVAEEIEDLSRREHLELRSRLNALIVHILIWQHQPNRRSSSSVSSILEQQDQIERILEGSPSLGQWVEPYFAREYHRARKRAAAEMGVDEIARRRVTDGEHSGRGARPASRRDRQVSRVVSRWSPSPARAR
ncbi:MAG: DUF29 domain-containing protein [Vulcanimicrobiaceae bacterium]